jgi:CubicO group peptidase (beta-lactamase class C family)
MVLGRARLSVLAGILVALFLGRCASVPTLQERLQSAVDGYLKTHDVPGTAVTVIMGGRATTVVGGWSNVQARRPVDRRTVFPVASIAKTYTAALTMKLVESGTVRLDDPVERWIPDLPSDLEGVRRATVLQLLSHTSGLPQVPTRDSDRSKSLNEHALLSRIIPGVCEPGSCFVYSDANYTLLGVLLQRATVLPLGEALSRILLKPLGLDDTFPSGMPDPPESRLAVLYRAPVSEPPEYVENVLPRAALGSVRTTVEDLAEWGDKLFGGDVVDPDSLDRMLDTSVSDGLPCPEGCPVRYGLGVFHYREAGRMLVGHDGGSGAIVARDNDAGLTVAIVTNGGRQDLGALLRTILGAVDPVARVSGG